MPLDSIFCCARVIIEKMGEDVKRENLKNGTPHSRYFSDELGVPTISIKYRTNVCFAKAKVEGLKIRGR